jgi:putative peptide zinc metalloprotease protein
VDASAANAFAGPAPAAVVSAAGIVVEMGLACLALAAWLALSPGMLRDAMLVIVLICSVSTLLFNANPLVRFDGYHVLCDALQLPNLPCAARPGGRAAGANGPARGRRARRPCSRPARPSGWPRTRRQRRCTACCCCSGWCSGSASSPGCSVGWPPWPCWPGSAPGLALGGGGRCRRAARAASLRGRGVLAGGSRAAAVRVPAPHQVVARGIVWPPDRRSCAPAPRFRRAAGTVREARTAAGDVLLVLPTRC